jgi:HD-GYP domain-containing protein (c-di-GMP phosphodiesterase class II)
MVSERAYRGAMPIYAAIAELHRCSGTQFDPHVVDVFCALAQAGELPLGQPQAAATPGEALMIA